jgi:hypothetical protein
MEDHHNLSVIYNKIRNESVDYLERSYGAIKVESEYPFKYPVTLKTTISLEKEDYNLLICLPFNFPDSFPKVKLDNDSFKKLYPLPHLDYFKTLCVFDDVLASPNPENPTGVLDATIQKSKEILLKGILKQNLDDYVDEMESYWAQESREFYISIVEPSEVSKDVCLIPFKFQNWLDKGIIADKKSEAIKWIQNLGGTFNEDEIIYLFYIPLSEPMKYPFPKNNKDIASLLKENNNRKDYISYLSKHQRPTKILFSMKLHDQYSWGIWEHPNPYKKVVSKYKGKRRIQTGLKGFRKNSQNGWLELIKDFPYMELDKYLVKDVRATRLKIRGGDGKTDNIGKKVAIIGCGAVGSHIAQGLMDIGIHELLLIDPDNLNFENINRHLCGAEQVGKKKTEAVKNRLRRHYPISHIHVCSDNVLSLLQTYPNSLNSYDLIIVAISNTPTELRLDELQKKNVINKPLLNIWVEPYLAGGHAVWNDPKNKTNFKTLLSSGFYRYQILKNGNLYSKKELGCNTSYVPYGVLELKKFIIEVLMFIQQQLNNEGNESKVLTWLGNLSEQKKNKRILSPRWLGADDFSVRINELD